MDERLDNGGQIEMILGRLLIVRDEAGLDQVCHEHQNTAIRMLEALSQRDSFQEIKDRKD